MNRSTGSHSNLKRSTNLYSSSGITFNIYIYIQIYSSLIILNNPSKAKFKSWNLPFHPKGKSILGIYYLVSKANKFLEHIILPQRQNQLFEHILLPRRKINFLNILSRLKGKSILSISIFIISKLTINV
jgi:hypothetical protein